jgi:small subunit ribosomal protein S7
MGRKHKSLNRPIRPDYKYNSAIVTKFIQRMMIQGKKLTAARIIYDAMDIIKEKTGNEPLEVFLKALENVKPAVEVKSRRVGGATYQVPIEIRETRREALATRWIINAARGRAGKAMADKLAQEFTDAFNNQGTAIKKKEDTHKMAEANKAFAHYRW